VILLETIATLFLDGLLIACLLASLTAITGSARRCQDLYQELSVVSRIEQLADESAAHLFAAPSSPRPRIEAQPRALVLVADVDRDGHIDRRSSEVTAFEILSDPPHGARLTHRIGRQRMTILHGLAPTATFAYLYGRTPVPVLAVLPLASSTLRLGLAAAPRS